MILRYFKDIFYYASIILQGCCKCPLTTIKDTTAFLSQQTKVVPYPPPRSIILQDNPIIEHNNLSCNNILGQAGLSKATLEISSEFSSNFLLRTHKSQLIQWLLRYSIFNILRSSSIVGCLHFEDLKNRVWSSKLQA